MCHKCFSHIFYQFFIIRIIPMYSVPPPPSHGPSMYSVYLPTPTPPPVQPVQTICEISTVKDLT